MRIKKSVANNLNMIEDCAIALRTQGAAIGTLGQALELVKHGPAMAAYLAVRCYQTRMANALLANHDEQGRPINEARTFDADPDDFVMSLRSAALSEIQAEAQS